MEMSIDEHMAQLKKLKSFHNGSYGTAIAEAIKALDASVQAAINAAGVTEFGVNTNSSNYAEVNANTGAISFSVKTVKVSEATENNTGVADAYDVKQYVDGQRIKVSLDGGEEFIVKLTYLCRKSGMLILF